MAPMYACSRVWEREDRWPRVKWKQPPEYTFRPGQKVKLFQKTGVSEEIVERRVPGDFYILKGRPGEFYPLSALQPVRTPEGV